MPLNLSFSISSSHVIRNPLRTKNASTPRPPGTNGLGILKQGFLEASNVNVVEELVTMIQAQRAYEMNSKAIQTSDQMLAKLAQL